MSSGSARSRLFQLSAAVCTAVLAVAGLTASSNGAAAGSSPPDKYRLSETQPTLTGTASGDKSSTSDLARTPAALKALTTTKRVPVLIKYDYDAVASYTGSVPGFDATSPSVTARPLSKPSAAVSSYQRFVANREASITRNVESTVPAVRVRDSYRLVYGGVSATVPGNEIRQLAQGARRRRRPGRHARAPAHRLERRVHRRHRPRTARSAATPNAGSGVIFGDIDTGVWPEHPSFADQGNLPAAARPAARVACNFGDNPLTPAVDLFVVQQQADRGRAVPRHLRRASTTTRELPGHRPRLRRPRHPHRVDRRRRHRRARADRSASTGGPITGIAPGA